jgi:hypothetical protein
MSLNNIKLGVKLIGLGVIGGGMAAVILILVGLAKQCLAQKARRVTP